jgi:enoyl-CoA hydratase/carnithine racemase
MWITLDGPQTMNSLNPGLLGDLNDAIASAEENHSLRALVITGSGDRAFSVGMDISFLESCFDDPEGTFLPFLEVFHGVLQRLESLPIPVIARVNGLARAGGFELIMACDFVIAADEAKVGDIHVEFGMSPGAGSSQRAPRKLGDQRAKALMLTPLWLDGPAMVDWGVALRSAPLSELDAEVENLVSLLRGRSRPAIAITKQLINSVGSVTFEEGLQREKEMFARLQNEVEESSEGFRAFVEKREPMWGDVDVRSLL